MDRIDKKTVAIILAGGSGSRMKSDVTKQRMMLCGRTVLYHSVRAFDLCLGIDSIVVVAKENEADDISCELAEGFTKPIKVVIGGKSRAESARCGFLAVPEDTDFVAIHDAARCLITPDDISQVLEAAINCGAATAVGAVYDTLKCVDAEGFITDTLDRALIKRAMTPQAFAYHLYKKALDAACDLSFITDDNMLIEVIGAKIKCVDVSADNIKITEGRDLEYAEYLMSQRGEKYV